MNSNTTTPDDGSYLDRDGEWVTPATPAQAEELAKKAVADYLNACHIATSDQVGNYLMKLASVAGVLMANAEGSENAHDRLVGTAQFVLKTMPKKPAKLVPVQ